MENSDSSEVATQEFYDLLPVNTNRIKRHPTRQALTGLAPDIIGNFYSAMTADADRIEQ